MFVTAAGPSMGVCSPCDLCWPLGLPVCYGRWALHGCVPHVICVGRVGRNLLALWARVEKIGPVAHKFIGEDVPVCYIQKGPLPWYPAPTPFSVWSTNKCCIWLRQRDIT